jgi:cytochrome c oxidase subunit IV
MLCSCFALSFDACIVTITWSLLFVVIALSYLSNSVDYSHSSYLEWFIDVGVFSHISSADEETFGFTHEHDVRV